MLPVGERTSWSASQLYKVFSKLQIHPLSSSFPHRHFVSTALQLHIYKLQSLLVYECLFDLFIFFFFHPPWTLPTALQLSFFPLSQAKYSIISHPLSISRNAWIACTTCIYLSCTLVCHTCLRRSAREGRILRYREWVRQVNITDSMICKSVCNALHLHAKVDTQNMHSNYFIRK